MKKAIISIWAILLMVSCQKNELVPEYVSGECDLYASIESLDATKTVMDKDNNVLWSAGDQIVAFMGTTIGVKYQIKESFVGSSAGGFSKVADSESGDDLVAGQEIDHNVVLYPYSASAWCMKNDSNTPTSLYKLNIVLPETQFYAENSFGIGAFPMVAVSEDNNLTFKNICGGLKLQFIGTAKIKSIKLEGLAGEKISGKSSVAYTENGVPKIAMATDDESYSHVTLDCGEGVQLSETNPTTFIIAVPPVEFASGMQITVTDTDGLSRTLTNSSKNTIKRSSLLKFPVITYKSSVQPAVNLSEEGTANSYIVSQKGTYKFSTVKGNSSESVGAVASAEVLWETFGTDVTPNVGDLVKNVVYSDGYITFQISDTFNEGNAVIAAKDASGNILWSWHIWLTDQPQEQVYFNNAGTMMDRNLGATSATPGDVGALGLLYQWGRKDPFLGSSSISNSVEAKSTITWPSLVSSDSSNGTIEYATTYPTTFIIYNGSNYDWYYTGDDSTDNTRWATSNKTKSIYDPCPFGWRVPDGGSNGVWSKALGSSSSFTDSSLYDSTNEGINFSGKFGSDQTIWLPASGCRSGSDGGLYDVGSQGGYCWSASPFGSRAYFMDIRCDGDVNPSSDVYRAYGLSVRCLQE